MGGEMSLRFHPESSASSELYLEKGEVLTSPTCKYKVMEVIGEGVFGKVLECWSLDSWDTVAIKVLKKEMVTDTQHELTMLKTISILDPDQTNLVRFLESFTNRGHTCLAFEKLDMDLFEFLTLVDLKPLCPTKIRDIAEQLLVVLDSLKGLAVLHGDIKPDNVMLVSLEERPLRVKLVDFGKAIPTSDAYPGMIVQAIGYRAPEVCLGLPFNEAVDVWGVGCLLAFLYLGGNLFPVRCNYQMMRSVVQILGQPSDQQLSQGLYTNSMFIKEEVSDEGPRWRLMTPDEYSAVNTTPARREEDYFQFPGGLNDLMDIYPVEDYTQWMERGALVHLLKALLHLEGEKRLTPAEALLHPFITRSYLSQVPLDDEPLTSPSQDPVTQNPLGGPPQDPLNEEPFDGPSQDLFNKEPLNEEPLDKDPLSNEPIDGPPQDPFNEESLNEESLNEDPLNEEPLSEDPLDGPSKDPLSEEPLDGEPLDGPSQDPLNENLLDGPSQNPLSEEPLNGPSQDPLNEDPLNEDPLSEEPLDGPSQDPQDSSLGRSQLSRTLLDITAVISIMEQRVDVEEEPSGSSEEPSEPEDVPLRSTSTSWSKRVRTTIRRLFQTIRNTLCCCLKPQIEE